MRNGTLRRSLVAAAFLATPAIHAWAQDAPAADTPAPATAPPGEATAPPADATAPQAEAAAPAAESPAPEGLKSPDPIPERALGPVLKTIPTPRQTPPPPIVVVDSSVLPKDRQSIWVLDFEFKPIRMRTVELPGKGRRQVHYMWYRVTNRTGKPRMFAPQFTLVTDTGKRYEDMVLPQAVEVIRNREDPTRALVGAVTVMGYIPPSGSKQGVDDSMDGVAVWEGIDPKADAFTVYIRGLSDGYKLVTPPGESEPQIRYKTLKVDFTRPGDERNLNEREIRIADPPYEWTYR